MLLLAHERAQHPLSAEQLPPPERAAGLGAERAMGGIVANPQDKPMGEYV